MFVNIKILADSACDLSSARFDNLPVEVVPLTVQFGGNEYKDRIDISPKTVYDAMRNGQIIKTSQVSPQTFKQIFTEAAEQHSPLLYLAFSSGLSGTYQTAKMIEQEIKEDHPDAPIYVLDTKCASLGYGLVVLRTAEQAAAGASMEELIALASHQSAHMEHIFTVDDLDYLYRGGRVSKTAAFIGSLLNIKPLLHVDDGKLIPLEKIRGTKKVLSRMVQVMKERGTDFDNQVIGISHGDDLARAEQLAALVRENFPVKDIVIEMVGAVIGAHSGPGTLALFFLNDTKS